MKNLKPIAVLALLATIVPEATTGSTPLSVIFTPAPLLILSVGYGLAVLVIREFAVRMNLGIGGLFLLGIAYGFVNEGLFAKTILRETALPMSEYDGYAYILGVNLAFALAITLWHAVSSVLFPILATYVLFPSERGRPWIGKKTVIALAVIVLALSLLMHLDPKSFTLATGTWTSALSLLAVIGVLAALATRLKSAGTAAVESAPGLGPVWLGASTFVFLFLVLSELIAGKKLPFVLFLAAYALGLWLYMRTLRKRGWLSDAPLLLFTVGCYLTVILMGFLLAFGTTMPVERIATESIFLLGAIWLIRRTVKRHASAPRSV